MGVWRELESEGIGVDHFAGEGFELGFDAIREEIGALLKRTSLGVGEQGVERVVDQGRDAAGWRL